MLMKKFDATTAISSEFGLFGIPYTEKESRLVLIPVPWEVTTSYGWGASWGPQIIREASEQIDLFDIETKKSYEQGYFMRPFPKSLKKKNDLMKKKAQKVIELTSAMSKDKKKVDALCKEVNQACREMTKWVKSESASVLKQNKLLGLVGGDHSTPWGCIQAVSEKYKGDFAILHIDAHADLRKAYQGFEQSHASIMYNVMTHESKPKKLVQLGIRDFCEEEYEFIQSRKDIKTFFDLELKKELHQGTTWSLLTQKILNELPENVYISFDIDGLDPAFCPHTGTPVPGGLSVDQMFFLFHELVRSGRRIVGFDLNEVSTGGLKPEQADPWDGNVGARVLYKLCGWSIVSNN